MAKVKYQYNTQSLRYERVRVSFWQKTWRVVGFISSAIMFAVIIIAIAYTLLDSPKEKQLKREINQLTLQYDLLDQQLDQMTQVLADLQDRDDNIYRVIFEAEPIPNSIRNAGYGGADLYKQLNNYENSEIMISASNKLERIRRQLYIQSKSYDEVYKMVKNKEEMLSSIPAIQPVSNKNLKRMASGYGYRIHPIYKTRRMHWGMDFTAPTGTEIYATGDGKVIVAKKARRGYGNHVIVDHGYGYQTVYAHMSKIETKRGQKVKRGDLLGFVGNTGLSTAPHLHYEVHKDGRKVNPINFYYNDLSPEEYDKMIELSAMSNQSFD